MLKKLHFLLFILVMLLISGCTDGWRNPYPQPSDTITGTLLGAAGGAVLTSGNPGGIIVGGVAGGLLGLALSSHETLLHKLASNGVQIIVVGDQLTLILPSDRFFVTGTPLLNSNYYSVLDQIAEFITGFEKYTVKVAGYTDNAGSPQRNLALSQQQALNVADYLWKRGIDTRVISSIGHGEDAPIANNNTSRGQAMNRRIEITMTLITDEQYVY